MSKLPKVLRKGAKYFLVAILILGLCFLAIEGMLRVLPAVIQANSERFPPLISNSYLGVNMPTNFDETKHTLDGKSFRVTTNDLGFGDIGFRDPGIEGSVYAVALGDSFAYGHGANIEDVWTEQLQQKLNKEVVNMGVPSYSTAQEERIFTKYASKLDPEVTILLFFENDYLDNYLFQQYLENPQDWKAWIRDNVYIYKLYSNLKRIWYDSQSKSLDYVSNNETYTYYPNMYGGDLQINYTLTEEVFRNLKEGADSTDTRLLIVYVPYREFFYREHLMPDSKYDFDRDTRNFYSMCSKLQIDCMDVLDDFRKAIISGKNVYLGPIDGHLNENGNLVLANAIYNHMRIEGLA